MVDLSIASQPSADNHTLNTRDRKQEVRAVDGRYQMSTSKSKKIIIIYSMIINNLARITILFDPETAPCHFKLYYRGNEKAMSSTFIML